MLKLNSKQISFLRAAGHTLNAVVIIGNKGLSEQVLKEIDVNLKAHELIKIKVQSDEREQRAQLLQQICENLGATAVQHIGKQLVIYRRADKPHIVLP